MCELAAEFVHQNCWHDQQNNATPLPRPPQVLTPAFVKLSNGLCNR